MLTARMLEVALVSALLAVALLPLVARAWREQRRPVAALLVLGWIGLPPALTLGAATLLIPPPTESEVTKRPIEVPIDDYTSSKACEACHPSEYAS